MSVLLFCFFCSFVLNFLNICCIYFCNDHDMVVLHSNYYSILIDSRGRYLNKSFWVVMKIQNVKMTSNREISMDSITNHLPFSC